MNTLNLQKKRQRKEAKRNLKRKTIRKQRNQFIGLGRKRQTLALERAKRTKGIQQFFLSLDAIIKRWSDKFSQELIAKIEKGKQNIIEARKTKNILTIDLAIKDFEPTNKEIIDIYNANEYPESVKQT